MWQIMMSQLAPRNQTGSYIRPQSQFRNFVNPKTDNHIYKLGDSNFYEVALSSQDFTDALARISYLGKVSENDERLVRRVKAEADNVRDARDRVDQLKQGQAVDTNALISRKKDLEKQLATGKSDIDRRMVELTRVRTLEQEEETRRMAEESASIDASSIYTGVMGPSVVVSNEPPAGLQASGIAISGMASWYGPGFQGNTTANGEIYNMYGFTAAHKSLPFNTWLKVTHNGRSVFVRINPGWGAGGRQPAVAPQTPSFRLSPWCRHNCVEQRTGPPVDGVYGRVPERHV